MSYYDIFFHNCLVELVIKLYIVYLDISKFSLNLIVGRYSPIGNTFECEASVLRSIHSSGELKDALCGPTACSDPMVIMDWGGVLFMSLRIWHMRGSTIFGSRRLPICHQ